MTAFSFWPRARSLKGGEMSPTNDDLLEMYRRLLRIRYFDEAACEQQRQGRIPAALHTSTGQEAAVVGACMALRADDYLTGNHRSHGHPIAKVSLLLLIPFAQPITMPHPVKGLLAGSVLAWIGDRSVPSPRGSRSRVGGGVEVRWFEQRSLPPPDCGGSCRHPGSGRTTPESSCRHG
jgi:hypothetical protein